MTFYDQIIVTIIDKGVLALLVVALGYKVKLWLQEDQSRRDLVREVSVQRAAAYEKIWKATEDFRSTDPPDLDPTHMAKARDNLKKAYFDHGGAMYLSHEAASRLLFAKKLLAQRIDHTPSSSTVSDEALRSAFSRFRSQLKADLLIYTEAEKDKPLQANAGGGVE